MAVRLAHLTDVHLGPLPALRPRDFQPKRVLGALNWALRRRFIHLPETVEKIVADLKQQRVDLVLVSGDLTNLGLPREFEAAAGWLDTLGAPDRVAVIPGNHDVYVPLARDLGIGRWQDYMAGETLDGQPFPYLREVQGVAIIGVNSAILALPGRACGRVGSAQRERLARLLTLARDRGLFRLVMIHHPPLPGLTHPRRALLDASAFRETLARYGTELVIHGHNHRAMEYWCDGPDGAFPVIGAGSASVGTDGSEPLASYHVYEIAGQATSGWQLTVTQRGLTTASGAIQNIATRLLEIPRSRATSKDQATARDP